MVVSEAEIERLYVAEHAVFQRALSAMLRDPDAGREVTQEAFARALARRASFRGPSLAAWVWRPR